MTIITKVEADKSGQDILSMFRHRGSPRYDDSTDHDVIHDWSGKLTSATLCKAIEQISRGQKVGAHFHGVVQPGESADAYNKASNHSDKTMYDGAPNLGRIGTPLYDTQFDPDGLALYLANASADLQQSRELFAMGRSPMDLIRALLEEGSPKGARLLRIDGKPCPIGMIRYMDDGSAIGWHIDSACVDVPWHIETQQIESQITIVIPFSESEEGGETHICPVRLSSLQYDANRLDGDLSYAIREDILPDKRVKLRGRTGDVMLFESRYPHCVTKVIGGARYTLSGFIGVCRDGSLVLFS